MTHRPHTVSLADDDRARIPFAIIAVLLLVSSVMIVAVLQSRDTPDVDREASFAMERAEAITTSEIRQAVVRALDEGARQPVTSTDGASPAFEDAIDDADGDAVFERYLELLVYREIAESLESAEQTIGTDRTATSSVERIDWGDGDELAAAIDRVTLEQEAEDGIVTATVEDVELTVADPHGETTTHRDVTVSVGTTVFELHERTELFESQLNTGFFESDDQYDGFGRYFAARMYPYAWGKAYYDRLVSTDRTFHNVTPNEHTEVMANDAIFALQERSFGTTDPYKERAMALPQLCMAGDLAADASDIELEELLPDDSDTNLSEVEGFCESDVLDVEGELPEPPTVQDIVMTLLEDHVETDVEIQVHPFADAAYMEMEADRTMADIEAEFNETLAESERFNEKYLKQYFTDKIDNQDVVDDVNSLDTITDEIQPFFEEAEFTDRTADKIKAIYDVDIRTNENHLVKHGQLPDPHRPSQNATLIDSTYITSGTPDADASINVESDDYSSNFDNRNIATVEIEYNHIVGNKAEWTYNNSTTTTQHRSWIA